MGGEWSASVKLLQVADELFLDFDLRDHVRHRHKLFFLLSCCIALLFLLNRVLLGSLLFDNFLDSAACIIFLFLSFLVVGHVVAHLVVKLALRFVFIAGGGLLGLQLVCVDLLELGWGVIFFSFGIVTGVDLDCLRLLLRFILRLLRLSLGGAS